MMMLNPHRILVKFTSNRRRILIESFCRFDVEILVEIDIETLSNRRQIHVKSMSNPHRIDIESLSIRRQNPRRNPRRILIEPLSNRRQIHVESTSNPHRIDIESFCRFDVEILVEIDIETLLN